MEAKRSIKRTVEATFIGKDGSLGYSKNSTYLLNYSQYKSTGVITVKPVIGLDLPPVEYGSIYSFLNNWSNVKQKDVYLKA